MNRGGGGGVGGGASGASGVSIVTCSEARLRAVLYRGKLQLLLADSGVQVRECNVENA